MSKKISIHHCSLKGHPPWGAYWCTLKRNVAQHESSSLSAVNWRLGADNQERKEMLTFILHLITSCCLPKDLAAINLFTSFVIDIML